MKDAAGSRDSKLRAHPHGYSMQPWAGAQSSLLTLPGPSLPSVQQSPREPYVCFYPSLQAEPLALTLQEETTAEPSQTWKAPFIFLSTIWGIMLEKARTDPEKSHPECFKQPRKGHFSIWQGSTGWNRQGRILISAWNATGAFHLFSNSLTRNACNRSNEKRLMTGARWVGKEGGTASTDQIHRDTPGQSRASLFPLQPTTHIQHSHNSRWMQSLPAMSNFPSKT